jgi:hypothetical protein
MDLFISILLIIFFLFGAFSLYTVAELISSVYGRRNDRTRLARLESSNDLFMMVSWIIAACVCGLIFILMVI